MTDLRRRLTAGETLYGTFLGLGSSLAAEACALAGFDWLLVDLEHGAMLVRVESTDRIRAGRVLDLGAEGVMFPRLESAADAEQAVRHLRYPRQGDRGVATYNRACGFGLHPEALATANDRIVGIIQVENRPAVERVADIAAVPGVDVLFIGPRDLSYDLGVPGDTSAPVFREAVQRVLAAADHAGIAAGILAPDADTARRYADDGFRFIGVSSDATLLAMAGRQVVDAMSRSSAAEVS